MYIIEFNNMTVSNTVKYNRFISNNKQQGHVWLSVHLFTAEQGMVTTEGPLKTEKQKLLVPGI